MSAAPVVSVPQTCPVICACVTVLRISKREAVAAWLRVSLDTVDRLSSDPSEARWTYPRIKAFERFEHVVHSTRSISAAILADELEELGDAMEAVRAVSCDINEAASEIQLDNAFLADGGKDRNRAEALAVWHEQHAMHEYRMAAHLRAAAVRP